MSRPQDRVAAEASSNMLSSSAYRGILLRGASLACLSLVSSLALAVPAAAQTAGGAGGAGVGAGGTGGVGGSGFAGAAGGNGGVDGLGGGGGGGGSAGAGAGGLGGATGGGNGGAGGFHAFGGVPSLTVPLGVSVTGAAGSAGGAGVGADGGGGGGAGGYGVIAVPTVTNNGNISGGTGGAGGASVNGGAGAGGDGGLGVFFLAPGGTLTNSGVIAGGNGGNGGSASGTGAGGAGGGGGAGVLAIGSKIDNSGVIVGGVGGLPGTPVGGATQGAGGVGVAGAGLAIVNTGTIAGGGGADALLLTGANSLSVGAGSKLVGGVNVNGPGASLTFDQTTLGDATIGNVVKGDGSVVVNAGANTLTLSGANAYTGTTSVATGALKVSGQIGAAGPAGGIGVADKAALNVTNTGVVDVGAGVIANAGAVTNDGVIKSVAVFTGGTLTTTGAIEGAVVNVAGGTVNAQGAIKGDVVNGGKFNVTGPLTGPGQVVNAATGALTVDPTAFAGVGTLNNAGQVVIGGALVANKIAQTGGAIFNVGSLTGVTSIALDGGGLLNLASVTTGALSIGKNAGMLNAGTTQSAAVIDNAGEYVNVGLTLGGLKNTGIFTQGPSGALAGGLTNAGTANAAGAIAGLIGNSGTFKVIGDLRADVFVNSGGGTLDVQTGTFEGLTTDLSVNNGGALKVQNGATLTAKGGIVNTKSGSIVNDGTINDLLNNNGVVVNNGAYNADVVNDGAAAKITNSATGVWTGNVLANTNGAQIVNQNIWNGDASNASGVIDNQATWNGAINNGASGTFKNSTATSKLTGLLTTAGTATNSGTLDGGALVTGGTLTSTGAINGGAKILGGKFTTTGTVNGGVNNATAGTVNAAGTIAGGVVNAGAFEVVGALDNKNGNFENKGAGTLTVSGGNYTKIGTLTNSSTAAAGVSVSAGKILSATNVVNKVGSTIGNLGKLNSGTAIQNSGTYNNAGTTSGGLDNKGSFNQVVGATLNGGLTNSKLVNAAGAINGVIVNNSQFNVTGALKGDGVSAFKNNVGATLSVGANFFTNVGGLTNLASVTIDALGTLGAATFTNNGAGTVINSGTLATTNKTINNAIFTNNATGKVSGGVINNSKFTSNGVVAGGVVNSATGNFVTTGTVNGGIVNSGAFKAQGTTTGAIVNDNGGVFTLTSALSNDTGFANKAGGALVIGGNNFTIPTIANAGLISLGSGKITGNVNNGGTITSISGTIAGNLTNTGLIDLATVGADPLTNTLNVTGAYTGGGALNVVAKFADLGGQRAGELLVGGAGSGVTAVTVNPTGATGYFNNPILIAKNAPGSTSSFLLANAGALNSGLVSYNLEQIGSGQWFLVPNLNTGALSAVGGSVASAITSATTGFFQNASAFVSSPPDAKPNQLNIGLWSRAAVGRADVANSSSAPTASGRVGVTNEKTRALYNGYQVGLDVSVSNFENTQFNFHGGITAGQYFANAFELLGSGTTSRFDVPFVGVYGAVTGHGFFADVLFRHDFWNANITNYQAGLYDKRMGGRGWSGSASAGYHWDVFENWFVEPSLAIHVTSIDFDSLPVAAGASPATLSFNSVRSTLGRVGLRVGTTYVVDKFAFQPFASVSGWNEFEGNITEIFQQNVSYVPISVSRVGAFAQFGLGVSAQIIDTGWIGFVRGDYRTGDKLSGAALNGGVSYRF